MRGHVSHFVFIHWMSLVALAATQTGCGSGASGAQGDPSAVIQPASPGQSSQAPPTERPASETGVLAPDAQTLQHVRIALAEEPTAFSTPETIDARTVGLIGDGTTDETAALRQ